MPCPICRRLFPVRTIHNHVECCLLEGNWIAGEGAGGGGGGDARAAADRKAAARRAFGARIFEVRGPASAGTGPASAGTGAEAQAGSIFIAPLDVVGFEA